jgi:hypothetical protein
MHTLDYIQAEPESEIQEEQVQEEYGGPLAPSCMCANIVCEQGKSWCIPPICIDFYVSINIYITVGLCITSIGIV